MPVYAIRCGLDGPVKIGVAKDVRQRLATLQTAHHEELHLLQVWSGGADLERVLHSRFSERRLSGEWFSFDAEMTLPDLPRRLGFKDRPEPRGARRQSSKDIEALVYRLSLYSIIVDFQRDLGISDERLIREFRAPADLRNADLAALGSVHAALQSERRRRADETSAEHVGLPKVDRAILALLGTFTALLPRRERRLLARSSQDAAA